MKPTASGETPRTPSVRPGRRTPRFHFLLCGSPTDAFYSQIAFFRVALDALGEPYRKARVTAVFGALKYVPIPGRWRPHFRNIEIEWAGTDRYRLEGYSAQGDQRYERIEPDADIACLCDADSALLRPFPDDFVEGVIRDPSIGAVVAHFPLCVSVDHRGRPGFPPLHPSLRPEELWEHLGRDILGRVPDLPLAPTLVTPAYASRCPFYVNYGFVVSTPVLLCKLGGLLKEIQPRVRELVGNWFYEQASVALAVEKASLPWKALPLRYNFPNDPLADELHPDEIGKIVLFHYLRTDRYDRHRIFTSVAEFERFLSLDLQGADSGFQDRVRAVTEGRFPFGV